MINLDLGGGPGISLPISCIAHIEIVLDYGNMSVCPSPGILGIFNPVSGTMSTHTCTPVAIVQSHVPVHCLL